jgi:hypothetical protein
MSTIESIYCDVSRVLAMLEQYRPMLEQYRPMLEQYRPMLEQYRPMLEHAQKMAAEIERYRPTFDYVQKLFEDIERFRRDNKIIADCYRDTVRKYLAARGWYVGPSLTGRNIVKLAKAIEEGGHDEAIEKAITDHVRSNVGAIEAAVTTHWPHREAVLGDAFEAHKKGRYTLSIPVLLSQADGMAFDILRAFIFTNHNGAKIADKAKELIDTEAEDHELMCSFVGILLEEHSIRVSTEKRDERRLSGDPVSPLNRHGVMHGIDLDYPTEANSLRVISLLSLLTDVHKLKNKPEET